MNKLPVFYYVKCEGHMSSNSLCQNDQFTSNLPFAFLFYIAGGQKTVLQVIITFRLEYRFFCERLMHTDFNALAVQECRAINNSNQTISTRRKEDAVFESS